jgi:choline monooxygenase
MQRYFADEIRQRVAAEKARTHYPSGFPALPPVAAARYCDPGFLQLERDHVFGKSWLFVAHVDVLEQKATTIWLLEQGHSRMFIGQYRRFERNPLLPRFPKVNPVTGEGQYAYLIYPNTILGVSVTMIFVAQAWPLAPGEMRYDSYYMLAAPMDARSQTASERMNAATERVLEEDLGNLTFMQNSFEAGTIASIPLSYQERRIYHLHEAIDRSIGAELIPARLRVPAILGEFVEQ